MAKTTTVKNLRGNKTLSVRQAHDRRLIEVAWHDGGGTRYMWVSADEWNKLALAGIEAVGRAREAAAPAPRAVKKVA